MVIKFINSKEFLENVILVINSKRLSNVKAGYALDVVRQSACLVLNTTTVYSYGFLFNCTVVGQVPDSMTALK